MRSATDRLSIHRPQSRVDEGDALLADRPGRFLDAGGDEAGALDHRRLDVDDAEAEADSRVDLPEVGELAVAAVGELEQHVVAAQVAEVVDELIPAPLLDRLAAVVAEAEVHRRRPGNRVEDAVDSLECPLPLPWMPRKVGLVHLDHVGVDLRHLCGEYVGKGEAELGGRAVMAVEKGLGQHVGAGQGELQGASGEAAGEPVVARQVEGPLCERAFDHGARPGAEGHPLVPAELRGVGPGDLAAHVLQRPHEVLDHAVGFGVVDVEPGELAVGDDVDAGILLRLEHHRHGVGERLPRRHRRQPVRDRVTAHYRRLHDPVSPRFPPGTDLDSPSIRVAACRATLSAG